MPYAVAPVASPAIGFSPSFGTSPTFGMPSAFGMPSTGSNRATGLQGGFQGLDQMALSDELLEEMEQGGSLNGLFGTNPQQNAQMTELQQELMQLFVKLQELCRLLSQQMVQGDEQGAQATQQEIADVQQQIAGKSGSAGSGFNPPAGTTSFPGYSPAASGGGGTAGGGEAAGATGASSGQPGANAVEASPEDFKGDNATGRELAALAVQHATDGTGDGGHCFRNVGDDLRKIGIQTHGEGAWEAADQLAAQPDKVKELKGIRPEELKKLPAGAVVVWNRGNGHQWGHISIATGDGREASDVMRNQITNYGTSYRVFMPVDKKAA